MQFLRQNIFLLHRRMSTSSFIQWDDPLALDLQTTYDLPSSRQVQHLVRLNVPLGKMREREKLAMITAGEGDRDGNTLTACYNIYKSV